MKRREFLYNASAVAASCLAPHLLNAQNSGAGASTPISGTLTVDESAALATIPQDFIGLSYESAQLANPAFFSAENKALIALFRELNDEGVLRLGGGTSEFTAFTNEEPPAAAPFDAVGPDTSKNVKSDTPITPKSLRNLRAFLDATNWRCLYGLNLGRGLIDRTTEEAFQVQEKLGPRLIAFQLGNEPDAWRNRYRPATWSYADYWKEWSAAHAAVVARVPQAKFAGPDVSNKMAYVTGFAEDVKRSAPDVVMLTSHYYAMGPAGAPGITLDKLLSPDPKLERDLQIAMTAAHSAGLPYRMSEGNSCWNGGQRGVSDTLASALWVADMMLDFASPRRRQRLLYADCREPFCGLRAPPRVFRHGTHQAVRRCNAHPQHARLRQRSRTRLRGSQCQIPTRDRHQQIRPARGDSHHAAPRAQAMAAHRSFHRCETRRHTCRKLRNGAS